MLPQSSPATGRRRPTTSPREHVTDPDELATLASIPAPTGAEGERLRWIEKRIAHLPGERGRDAAGNLVWRFGAGRPELLVLAHVDVVFDTATPLSIRRDGSDLVGPGVGDNATALLALIAAVEELPGIPSRLAVAFTVGEEGLGNLRGSLRVCGDLQRAMVIALEGHGLDHVITEHVGSVRARVTVTGPGGTPGGIVGPQRHPRDGRARW